VCPVRYELDFYSPEYGILHSDSHENLKSYNVIRVFIIFVFIILYVFSDQEKLVGYVACGRNAMYIQFLKVQISWI
jgi:hypothetical protein